MLIHNITIKKNKTKTSYKLLYERKFDFTNIYVFGCNVYAYILKKVWKSKQTSCTRTTIYLKLIDFIKRYKLYNLKRKVVFIII
jgi:hypothetical protein